MCAKMWAGKKPGPVDEVVATSNDGGLMNAFVKLEGSFPETPVPSAAGPARPVRLLLQTARGGRARGPDAAGEEQRQPAAQRPQQLEQAQQLQRRSAAGRHRPDFKLSDEEMLKIGCDVHRWMTAWVGVVDHPYFAVSDARRVVHHRQRAGRQAHRSACGMRSSARSRSPWTSSRRPQHRGFRVSASQRVLRWRCLRAKNAVSSAGRPSTAAGCSAAGAGASSWTRRRARHSASSTRTASARPAWLSQRLHRSSRSH